ncbi:MAG: HlyD family efflux transporter periplasmic adaptor subunit [Clostridia bacterium]|nr:HlyD family efflux transporter periplasmic adaptor subunit [Clostridia bacterium]
MVKKLLEILRPTKKKIVIGSLILVVAVGSIVGIQIYKKNKAAKTAAEVKLSTVTRGNIEVAITGSGTVEPYARYEILATVNGEILSAPYEVGDSVKKGDVLYQIDSSDAEIELQQQENNLKSAKLSNEETQKTAEKLSITAPCDGVISDLDIKVGEEVSSSQEVATITNSRDLTVDLPFNESQIKSISVGQTATLSSSSHMSSVEGKVVHIASNPTAQSDGSKLYNVTITFTNPGSFIKGITVGGEINGMISPGSGTVQYSDEKTVKTETDGTISSVKHKNGDYVKKGEVIATIKNDDITNEIEKSNISYESSVLSLETKKNALEDYNIKSPIDGTVISKEYKAGDTIDKTNSSVTMMVVADISKLKFSLEIDELDISKIAVGQKVEITCDAVSGETFEGVITNVSLEGTTTNSVTTYTADVVIDNPGTLRPSMNVDASVIVESATNTLLLPATDVKTLGTTSYVFLKDTGTSSSSKGKSSSESSSSSNGGQQMKEGRGTPPPMTEGQEPPAMSNSASGGGETSSDASQSKKSNSSGNASRLPTAPDGFVTQVVTVGISNDDYVQILSGLNEGDQVYKQSTSTSSSTTTQMNMGMGMGMAGGMGGPPDGGGNRSSGSSSSKSSSKSSSSK